MSELIVTFGEEAVHDELKGLAGKVVENTLNTLLEEEADDLVNADRYECSADREAIAPATTSVAPPRLRVG